MALMFVATPIFASTNVYAPVDGVCANEGYGVYDKFNSYIISCIPKEDMKSTINLMPNMENFFQLVQGQTVALKNGLQGFCPSWFPMGCVVEKVLVR